MKQLVTTALLLLLFVAAAQAQDQKKVALVIGNGAYTAGNELKNPVNDANLMATTLKGLGFEVLQYNNVTKTKMDEAIYQFSQKAENADVVLFYYAGHGIQLGAEPYLVPIDANPENEKAAKIFCVNLKVDIIDALEFHEDNLNIVILDACRNNPFRNWKTSREMGGSRGFTAPPQPNGTIVAYATDEGATADDNPKEKNGLYTKLLVQELNKAQSIRQVFYNTRDKVRDASGKQQSPMFWDKTNGDYYLKMPEAQFGSISLDTEIAGTLYLDGKEVGKIKENSTNKLNEITVGSHALKIIGTQIWAEIVNVTENKTTYVKATNTFSPTQTFASYTETTAGLNLEMIAVKGGKFTMGSNDGESDEKPTHDVTLSDFYIGKYEVTVSEFEKFISETKYQTDADKSGDSRVYENGSWTDKKGVNWKCDVAGNLRPQNDYKHPVIHVSWNDANEYCNWLSKKTNKKYSLPSEAQWEYAAGGGTNNRTKWAGTNNESDLGTYAWFTSNSGSTTHEVGTTPKANSLGIYDMSGNVWEWCMDWYDSGYYKNSTAKDPVNLTKASRRVYRGGSWYFSSSICRVAFRFYNYPTGRSDFLGFRLLVLP